MPQNWGSLLKNRTEDFTPAEAQEALLNRLNDLFERVEPDVDGPPQMPTVLVVGAPRSGTTLLTQWLAASGAFAVPTNLVARFPRAPQVGLLLERLLTDPRYDFHGELGSAERAASWSSDIGKTVGLRAPHEFSYFWRRFLPLDQARPLTMDERAQCDWRGMSEGIRAFELITGLPFAAKGILLQYVLDAVALALPKLIVLHIVRDTYLNAQSLLLARERATGSRSPWFSVEPPGTAWLRTRAPEMQVAGQVVFTNSYIRRMSKRLPRGTVIEVDHSRFCDAPLETWIDLDEATGRLGYRLPEWKMQPEFTESTAIRVSPETEGALRQAIEEVGAWAAEQAQSDET